MKEEKRPWMLLYLLVGVLLLSTALNFYFLLRLDGQMADQELKVQLLEQDGQTAMSLDRAPPSLPDTASVPRR